LTQTVSGWLGLRTPEEMRSALHQTKVLSSPSAAGGSITPRAAHI
jgi:hypothetical protein